MKMENNEYQYKLKYQSDRNQELFIKTPDISSSTPSSSSSSIVTNPSTIKIVKSNITSTRTNGPTDKLTVTNDEDYQNDSAFQIATSTLPRNNHTIINGEKNSTTTNEIPAFLKVPKNNKKPKKVQNNLLRRRSSLSTELEGRRGARTSNADLVDDDDEFYPELQLLDPNSTTYNDKTLYQNQFAQPSNEYLTPSPYPSNHHDNHRHQHKSLSISPHSPHHHHPHTNVHSSMSLLSMTTNNAITVAPSRNPKIEPNVFDTGASRHHHKRHGGGRRRRSKTPEPNYSQNNEHSFYGNPVQTTRRRNGESEDMSNFQNVLNRLDHRIKDKFGDWSNMDDDQNFEYRSTGRVPQLTNNYFSHTNGQQGHQSPPPNHVQHNSYVSVGLPSLYQNYHAVLKSSKGKLLDKAHRIAMSKDNNDPNSILSQAKKTLTEVGGKVAG